MENWVGSQIHAREDDLTGYIPCITRKLSGTRGGHAEYFTIEQNGLHAVLVLCTQGDAICLERSTILFPTRISDRNNPRGYLQCALREDQVKAIQHKATTITYDGVRIQLKRDATGVADRLAFTYSIFVSPESPVVHSLLEYTVSPFVSSQPSHLPKPTSYIVSHHGDFVISYVTHWRDHKTVHNAWTCIPVSQTPSPKLDLRLRFHQVAHQWTNHLVLQCPDEPLMQWVQFAKIRSAEAVFDAPTLGLVHSPGGKMFYCGVWCNDQAEYAAPVYPYCMAPNSRGRYAMAHSLAVLADHFDMVAHQIPYSIEIDGGYIGRLDRGDAAMFALGASQFLMACFDYHDNPSSSSSTSSMSSRFLTYKDNKDIVRPLIPCVLFAADMLVDKMQQSPEGIVPSQSDELEGRYPTGDANLSTNCLAICALQAVSELLTLLSSTDLNGSATMSVLSTAERLKYGRQSETYNQWAKQLRANVDAHFATYAPWKYDYFADCGVARGWICLSEMAKLSQGKSALRHALTGLWARTGVRVTADHDDIWDRTTMYCITLAFQAQLQDLALDRLKQVSRARLAKQVYAVENQYSNAQLAAESSLVLRVVVHGLLGLQTRKAALTMTPVCPAAWPSFKVCNIWLGHHLYDVQVIRITRGYSTMLTVELSSSKQSQPHPPQSQELPHRETSSLSPTGVTIQQGTTLAIRFGLKGESPLSFDVLTLDG